MRLDRWFRVHFPGHHLRASAEAAALRPGAARLEARAGQRARGERPAGARAGGPAAAAQGEAIAHAAARSLQGRPRLHRGDDPLRGPGRAGAEQALWHRRAGRHRHQAPSRRSAGRHGRPLRRPAAAGAPARPRHHRRAPRRQASRRGGEARSHLPDALGCQDLLGAGQRRAEAAAGQGRGGAGQGRRAPTARTACARRCPASRRRRCTPPRTTR